MKYIVNILTSLAFSFLLSPANAQVQPRGFEVPESGRILITPSGIAKVGDELCRVLSLVESNGCEGRVQKFSYNHKSMSLQTVTQESEAATELVKALVENQDLFDNLDLGDLSLLIKAKNVSYDSSFSMMSLKAVSQDHILVSDIPKKNTSMFVLSIALKKFNLRAGLVSVENENNMFIPPASTLSDASIALKESEGEVLLGLPFGLKYTPDGRFEIVVSKNILTGSEQARLSFEPGEFNMTQIQLIANCEATRGSDVRSICEEQRTRLNDTISLNQDAFEKRVEVLKPKLVAMLESLFVNQLNTELPKAIDGVTIGPFFHTLRLGAAGSTNNHRENPTDSLFLGDRRNVMVHYPELNSCLAHKQNVSDINDIEVPLSDVMSCIGEDPVDTFQQAHWENLKFTGFQIETCAAESRIESSKTPDFPYSKPKVFFSCLGGVHGINFVFRYKSPVVVNGNLEIPLVAHIYDPNRPNKMPLSRGLFASQAADITTNHPVKASDPSVPDYDAAVAINKGVVNKYLQDSFARGYFNKLSLDPGEEPQVEAQLVSSSSAVDSAAHRKCERRKQKAMAAKEKKPNKPSRAIFIASAPAVRPTTNSNNRASSSDLPYADVRVDLTLNYIPKPATMEQWALKNKDNLVNISVEARISKLEGEDSLSIELIGAYHGKNDVYMSKGYKSTGSEGIPLLFGGMVKEVRQELECSNLKWDPVHGKPMVIAKNLPIPNDLLGFGYEVTAMKMDSNGHLVLYFKIKD